MELVQKQQMTFEKALERLEEIVQSLENADIPLRDSLGLFEEGVRLCKECSTQLSEAQGRLQMLTEGVDGSLDFKTFEIR